MYIYVELQCLALLLEESSFLCGEEWCDFAIYPCVVCVDPSDFVGSHATHVNHIGVVVAECQCFELEESLACGVCAQVGAFAYGNEVFDTDTILISAVEPRFVGTDIAHLQRVRVVVRADVLWSLVAAHEVTYAVACAVTIGHALLPEELAC